MVTASQGYEQVLAEVVELLDQARRASARSVNAVMTATYWAVGQRIVEHEQSGKARAGYGDTLLKQLATDLTVRFGRGFSRQNLQRFRLFYLTFASGPICSTVSSKLDVKPQQDIRSTVSSKSLKAGTWPPNPLTTSFPLPWSHYVRLMSLKSEYTREFYEAEALRGGWSFRQLDRQINSMFYERTALSRNKTAC